MHGNGLFGIFMQTFKMAKRERQAQTYTRHDTTQTHSEIKGETTVKKRQSENG